MLKFAAAAAKYLNGTYFKNNPRMSFNLFQSLELHRGKDTPLNLVELLNFSEIAYNILMILARSKFRKSIKHLKHMLLFKYFEDKVYPFKKSFFTADRPFP